MEFLKLAKKRYSVREYTDRQVEKEKLDKILKAAQAAPTACNRQPVHLVVVQSREGIKKIGKAANLHGASTAVLVCGDRDKAWVLCGSAASNRMCSGKSFLFRTIWRLSISWLWVMQPAGRQTRNAMTGCACRWKPWFPGNSSDFRRQRAGLCPAFFSALLRFRILVSSALQDSGT